LLHFIFLGKTYKTQFIITSALISTALMS